MAWQRAGRRAHWSRRTWRSHSGCGANWIDRPVHSFYFLLFRPLYGLPTAESTKDTAIYCHLVGRVVPFEDASQSTRVTNVFCDQLCGGILPVMQCPFGDGGLEPVERGARGFIQRVVICPAGVWLKSPHVGEMQSVIVAPFIGHAKFHFRLRLELLNALDEQRFQPMRPIQ